MKKYFYIYKIAMINEFKYMTDVIINFTSYLIKIIIFIYLWKFLYTDPNSLIAGISFKQMIWYVLTTELIWYGVRNDTLTQQATIDIKTGNIAYSLNKPFNYIKYIISKYFGEITIKFIIYTLFAILIGLIIIGPISFNLVNLPLIFIIFSLAFIINAIIRVTISMLSFYIEDAIPFHWLYDKIILILGTMFPIELFPKFLQPILKCSPIYVVTYGPAKLVINFSYISFCHVLIVQLLYLIITTTVAFLIYKKGVKKLNVYGG